MLICLQQKGQDISFGLFVLQVLYIIKMIVRQPVSGQGAGETNNKEESIKTSL